MRKLPHRDVVWWMQRAMMLVLAASAAWFVAKSIHWRLTGDASLMHYVTFLMEHGRSPYKDIGDINLPISYAPQWLVSHFLGAGDLCWRLYDLALLVVAGAAMYCIALPYSKFAAVWAGCLFAVIHGRDGLLQVGQRDFAAAVLLIAGVACLMVAMRGHENWFAAGFGLFTGTAAMMKPTLALFLLLVLVDYVTYRATDARAGRRVIAAVVGWLTPVLGCLVWVAAKGSLPDFWYTLSVVAPYHAAIGHAPTWFLLKNSLSPLPFLAGAWLVVRTLTWLSEEKPDAARMPLVERQILLLGAAFGYLSYLVQQRGYPYHRYPLQVFLLMLLAVDFTQTLRRSGVAQWISASALMWAAMVLAPVSAAKAGRYDWQSQPFRSAMEADLSRVAISRGAGSLDGKVQCLDSISGCIATLDAMRIEQSTGLMYDEFLFNPLSGRNGKRVIEDARARFLKDVEGAPPLVFVMSAPLFPAGPDEYRKLDQWPDFREWLNAHYALEVERVFTVAVQDAGRPVVPPGYRMYIRR